MNYKQFLESKKILDVPTGFEPGALPKQLFDFQRDCVSWACRRGRSALFEDCGLGKTLCYFEFIRAALRSLDYRRGALIFSPPMVVEQTRDEYILYIKADKNLEYSKVIDAMDLAAHNGVVMVAMVSDQKAGTTSTVVGDTKTPAAPVPPGGAK